MTITYKIPGEPKGKARPRVTKGHAYTPQATKDYETIVAIRYRLSGGKMFDGPVSVHLLAEYTIPKSATKAKRADMLSGKLLPLKKPDIDNVCKMILDGLNKVAFRDDSSVVMLEAYKRYSDNPGVTVTISSI